MSAAQRARAERQRLRARELRAGRVRATAPTAADPGGGFIPAPELPPRPVAAAPAPLPTAEAPPCVECGTRVHTSLLLDVFERAVCDECREKDARWELVARTEARREYLLQECDLDARPPPLRCVRRPNPHRAGGEMRLYLRADLHDRAQLVWGSSGGLAAERTRREEARARRGVDRVRRGVSALRPVKDRRAAAAHTHTWDDGVPHPTDPDTYTHTCTSCRLTTTIEKM